MTGLLITIAVLANVLAYAKTGIAYVMPLFIDRETAADIREDPSIATDRARIARYREFNRPLGAMAAAFWPFYLTGSALHAWATKGVGSASVDTSQQDRIAELEKALREANENQAELIKHVNMWKANARDAKAQYRKSGK